MNYSDSTALFVENIPQFFFDNAVIEQIQDLIKSIHRPKKQPGPLIQKDRSWEHIPYFTCNTWNVLLDRSNNQFKCWYEDWDFNPCIHAHQGDNIHSPPHRMRMCYACSHNGVDWQKPSLNYLKEGGQKTNVIFGSPSFGSVHAATIIDDLLEHDSKKRFKMLFDHRFSDGTRRIEAAFSQDGLKWISYQEPPKFSYLGPHLEDVLILTLDPGACLYRLATRHPGMMRVAYDKRRPITGSFLPPTFPDDPRHVNKRRIFQSMSSDLIHWSYPQCILAPDDQKDNLDDSYYGMVQFRMGSFYIGLLNVLHQVSNTMDVRLIYSRDGWRWNQINQRQPWLTPDENSWDRYMVNVPNVPIPVGEKSFIYYGGALNHHDWWITGVKENLEVPEAHNLDKVSYGLGLATLRRGGFVSIDAGPVREGIMITRALKTNGKNLLINAACRRNGYIQVEVTDEQEKVLPGCARAQCDTFSNDSIKATITWNKRALIPHDGCLRLRFFMRNASLYSFTLT